MRCKTTASLRGCSALYLMIGLLASPVQARADPLWLRADAIADTQSTTSPSPTGLVVLQGQDRLRSWIDAEGLVWAGGTPSATGDVLVMAVHAREPHGYGEVRVGRFVLATGAIFPVQIDGAEIIGRAPWGSAVETFGGVPVVPAFGPRAYDWIAGTRVSQKVASKVTFGVSYVQRREDGDVSNEEVGADFAAAPTRWLDLAAKGAYDLTTPGLADARASLATRFGGFRVEVFASQQSPGRLLPATSLFSVLGDFPSEQVGGTLRWRAAPRLDLWAGGAGQVVAGELGNNEWVRSTLRLDDGGIRNIGVELRRVDVLAARWTGVRMVSTQPLGRGFRVTSEIEIVVPDEPQARGIVWPWGLMALAWRPGRWELAAGLEAASTPQYRYETEALVRLARTLEIP